MKSITTPKIYEKVEEFRAIKKDHLLIASNYDFILGLELSLINATNGDLLYWSFNSFEIRLLNILSTPENNNKIFAHTCNKSDQYNQNYIS